jgi:hypothetical protein|tara:strand:+ start:269 stop:1183 length:915 start_codon:yes stop_codon:yes gene_type:complete
MPTIGDAVTRTKRLLTSNTRTELDAVGTEVGSAAESSLHLKYQTDGIRAGSYLSVGNNTIGYETMYVHSRNGEYATVQRGVDGSTALSTIAAGINIEVEPRFTGHQIFEAVKDAIRAFPENVFAVGVASVDFATSVQAVTVTLSNGFIRILSATRTARSSEDRLLKFNVTMQEYNDTYKLIRQEGIEKAVTAYVTYAYPFVTSTLAITTDLVDDIKMSKEMQDIPAIGAAAALVLGEESTRLDLHSAGDSRGDAALNPGDRMRYSLVLQGQYQRRISDEARRLMSQYGIRTDGASSAVFPTTIR